VVLIFSVTLASWCQRAAAVQSGFLACGPGKHGCEHEFEELNSKAWFDRTGTHDSTGTWMSYSDRLQKVVYNSTETACHTGGGSSACTLAASAGQPGCSDVGKSPAACTMITMHMHTSHSTEASSRAAALPAHLQRAPASRGPLPPAAPPAAHAAGSCKEHG